MKVKADQLREVIRSVVVEELVKCLPRVIEKVLTERYITTLVESKIKVAQVTPKKSKLAEMLDNVDEDEVPKPPKNDASNIYTTKKQDMRENKLLSDENKLKFLYEGLTPINDECETIVGAGVPLEHLGIDFGKSQKVLNEWAAIEREKKKSFGPIPSLKKEHEQMQQAKERRDAELEYEREARRSNAMSLASAIGPVDEFPDAPIKLDCDG